ncbi:MAG TPA: hypothetical protein VK157_09510 [Phycisphaerales bacterium]|nr:hypothetical protein [Phycisphaerales bacterium]
MRWLDDLFKVHSVERDWEPVAEFIVDQRTGFRFLPPFAFALTPCPDGFVLTKRGARAALIPLVGSACPVAIALFTLFAPLTSPSPSAPIWAFSIAGVMLLLCLLLYLQRTSITVTSHEVIYVSHAFGFRKERRFRSRNVKVYCAHVKNVIDSPLGWPAWSVIFTFEDDLQIHSLQVAITSSNDFDLSRSLYSQIAGKRPDLCMPGIALVHVTGSL